MKESPRTWPAAVSLTKNAEKASDKIQHSFTIETLQKVGTEGTYLNIPEATYDSHSYLHTQTVKSWKPSLQCQKQGCPLLPLFWGLHHLACELHWPGLVPYAANSLNHWTSREVLLPLGIKNWPFPVLGPLLSFPNLSALQHINSIWFEIAQLEFHHLH